jgi:hypothetical protein
MTNWNMQGLNYPPPGHPLYMSPEDRAKLEQKNEPPPQEPTKMSSAAAVKYQELKAKIAEAKKQMEETAKTAFADMAKEFFDANPTVLAFGWTQYTPYWNDGDVCTFRAQTDYPTVTMLVDGQALTYDENRGEITDNDGEEIRTAENWKRVFEGMRDAKVSSIYSDGKTVTLSPEGTVMIDGVRVRTHDDYNKVFNIASKNVSDFLGNFEDADLETMFGDHIQIMVARDGTIETEEYQHD